MLIDCCDGEGGWYSLSLLRQYIRLNNLAMIRIIIDSVCSEHYK